MPAAPVPLFETDRFEAQKKMLKLVGGSFFLRDLNGRLLAYSKQKAFKLKEDIAVFEDEEMTRKLLQIQADRILDYAASYSVVDAITNIKVGSLRRKGWTSVLRDSWEVLDAAGTVRGKVVEDNPALALIRRFIDFAGLFLPETFHIEYDGKTVGTMKQNFLGIPPKFTVDLTADVDRVFPRQLAVATVVLLLAIEGRQ